MSLLIGSVGAPLGYTLDSMRKVGLAVSVRVDISQRTMIYMDIILTDIRVEYGNRSLCTSLNV